MQKMVNYGCKNLPLVDSTTKREEIILVERELSTRAAGRRERTSVNVRHVSINPCNLGWRIRCRKGCGIVHAVVGTYADGGDFNAQLRVVIHADEHGLEGLAPEIGSEVGAWWSLTESWNMCSP